MELIGQTGIGYSFDPLVAESKDELTESVKGLVFVSIAYLSPWSSSSHA